MIARIEPHVVYVVDRFVERKLSKQRVPSDLTFGPLLGVVPPSKENLRAIDELTDHRDALWLPRRRVDVVANLFGIHIAEQGMPTPV